MEAKKYVSRGGIKLEHALKEFNVGVKGLTVLDVGSSTGGFVDCLLQHGAAKIYSLDTAYGELAWKLRQDPRVVVLERENILFLESLPGLADLVTIDVSFTSLTKILPAIKKFLKSGTDFTLSEVERVKSNAKIIALLKPQYEDQKLALKNHGVIPEESQKEIVGKIRNFAEENYYKVLGQTNSPILGGNGNKEFFLYLRSTS